MIVARVEAVEQGGATTLQVNGAETPATLTGIGASEEVHLITELDGPNPDSDQEPRVLIVTDQRIRVVNGRLDKIEFDQVFSDDLITACSF